MACRCGCDCTERPCGRVVRNNEITLTPKYFNSLDQEHCEKLVRATDLPCILGDILLDVPLQGYVTYLVGLSPLGCLKLIYPNQVCHVALQPAPEIPPVID